jgi:predicted component of type VI protein secretion system
MGKLIISFENAVLKTVPLNKERITIGRRPENDIQIDNLGVSGQHAAIVTVGNDFFLEDLKSTNGTLLNGQLAEKQLLKNNDVVEIGKHKLKFVAEAPAAGAGGGNYEKTMVIRRPGTPAPAPAAEAPAPAAAPAGDIPPTIIGGTGVMRKPVMPTAPDDPTPAEDHGATKVMPGPGAAPAAAPAHTATAPAHTATAPAMVAPAPAAAANSTGAMPAAPADPNAPNRPAALKVLVGAGQGKVLELTKNLTTLGKSGAEVVVFTKRPSGYYVAYVEGATFPKLNGNPLDAEPQQLKENDVIEISGNKLSFFYKPQ